MATEPPEQLLGTMRRHDPSDHDSYEQKTSFHLVPPVRTALLGLR
jgi:hypothetical protein